MEGFVSEEAYFELSPLRYGESVEDSGDVVTVAGNSTLIFLLEQQNYRNLDLIVSYKKS